MSDNTAVEAVLKEIRAKITELGDDDLARPLIVAHTHRVQASERITRTLTMTTLMPHDIKAEVARRLEGYTNSIELPLQRIFDAIEQGRLNDAAVVQDVKLTQQVLALVAHCQVALAGVRAHLKLGRKRLTDGDIVSAAIRGRDITLGGSSPGNGHYSAALVA
ncbi:hypothetical protein J8273_4070 [Carpediemonas membranifera]|uniref:Uncharacterized protein n=1 Tax=Carpediemonas membranifera TaxID=201153 RepID=A0A8J6B503_9EUKA|nr:hypothetical protein J8273_4070 [Carpediemonas membranifera]|eukprot:KAG9394414.1 hypothetical protein J8273_4070 [Carpediemonas membranifera]